MEIPFTDTLKGISYPKAQKHQLGSWERLPQLGWRDMRVSCSALEQDMHAAYVRKPEMKFSLYIESSREETWGRD